MDGGLNVFISYAREDARDLAIRLRDDLRAAGCSVWLDLSQIQGGDSWTQAIEDAIEACDVGIALLSHASYHSRFCRAEQMRLLRKGKRIVPILVQALADIPLHIEHLNYIDFTEAAHYTARVRDLFSDLNAGRAFGLLTESPSDGPTRSPFKPGRISRRLSVPEKRDAPSFRRHLVHLRREPWLAGRVWWTYFLFHCVDMEDAVDILKNGFIPPVMTDGRRRDGHTHLNFRPRTPELWHKEGIKPTAKRARDDIPRPVYLLFDLESILCEPESRFSAGEPGFTRKTFATSNAFEELPFEQIYHDAVPRPDAREEILMARRAQVLVPNGLTLETLQMIWCRSEAEADTLRALLPAEVRRRCATQMTGRADFNLFHRRGAYVEQVMLGARSAAVRLFVGAEPAPMTLRAEVTPQQGAPRSVEWADVLLPDSLTLDILPADTPEQPYTLTITLDGTLAYKGEYWIDAGLI